MATGMQPSIINRYLHVGCEYYTVQYQLYDLIFNHVKSITDRFSCSADTAVTNSIGYTALNAPCRDGRVSAEVYRL